MFASLSPRLQQWPIRPTSFVPFSAHYHLRRLSSRSRVFPYNISYEGFRRSISSRKVSDRNYTSLHLPKTCPPPRILTPHVYTPSFEWHPFEPVAGQKPLDQGDIVRVASWNINFQAPDRAPRASAAMAHLRDIFGDPPPPLVVMLQEVDCLSLEAILADSWIREHFVLSNVEPPQRYFTLMMVSPQIQAENWFRVPFESRMERDALVVDISISSPGGESEHLKKIIRLCTTHLESLPEIEGRELRPRQLAQISKLLKVPPSHHAQIIGGLVGGDMNPISPVDAVSHRTEEVDLRDVWEDTDPPPFPLRKPFKKDLTYGKARGNTWGYQSPGARSRKRLDKFFYTGMVDTVPLAEAQDLSGKIGRLGINVKTRVDALIDITSGIEEEENHQKFSGPQGLREKEHRDNSVLEEEDVWVSDHFGIAIGLRVP
ncbi:MAG: hypothetical protein M1837_006369 [Sclerophora amabilis]|nr:MAG: hypothetical protein M1837_006369 [Sclerophora amabilis]